MAGCESEASNNRLHPAQQRLHGRTPALASRHSPPPPPHATGAPRPRWPAHRPHLSGLPVDRSAALCSCGDDAGLCTAPSLWRQQPSEPGSAVVRRRSWTPRRRRARRAADACVRRAVRQVPGRAHAQAHAAGPDFRVRTAAAPCSTGRCGPLVTSVHCASDLGAGKSVVARGLIRARCGDATLRVTSPTYLLQNSYTDSLGRRWGCTHVPPYPWAPP